MEYGKSKHLMFLLSLISNTRLPVNLVYGEVHNPRRMCCTYIRPYMGITFDTTHLESTQGH